VLQKRLKRMKQLKRLKQLKRVKQTAEPNGRASQARRNRHRPSCVRK